MRVPMSVQVHIQRPEARGLCLSQLLPVLYFEVGSLMEFGVQRLARSVSPPGTYLSTIPYLHTGVA